MEQVGDDAFLVGGTSVNWLVVRDGRDVTLVDCGYPGDRERVVASLAELGHAPGDVAAVLLTHAHVDHVGACGWLHREHGVPALAHPDELPMLHGERVEQAPVPDIVRRSWRPRVALWALSAARAGGRRHEVLPHVRAFDPAGTLDLPGSPQPVPVPGHTAGSTAFRFPGLGLLASGDALITGHAISPVTGPQLVPDFFSTDPAATDTALDVLADVDADTLAPGHGPAWRGRPREAVARARASTGRRLR
ncbi:MBL fold metallo-hydrolase [Rhodococcus aerolatus]